jgi:hypothetical protein
MKLEEMIDNMSTKMWDGKEMEVVQGYREKLVNAWSNNLTQVSTTVLESMLVIPIINNGSAV